jgi:HD-GYP domain-containing protein (c-di-GMP phosphodiesterase class II)
LIASGDSTPTLFCSRDIAIESDQLRQIIKAGVSKLYIESNSYTAYQAHLRSNWKSIINQDRLHESDRTAVMSEVVRAVLSEQFSSADTESVVATCHELGSSIVSVLAERPVLVSELSNVMYHDYATFTHSSNVASYIAVLAKALGFSGEELQLIVVGALLHDIGKLEFLPNPAGWTSSSFVKCKCIQVWDSAAS